MKNNNEFRFCKLFSVIKILLLTSVLLYSCSEKKNENEISASGTIEATEITISSKSAGVINELLVDEGDRVKEDDVLFVIDHENLDIQLKQAQAVVEQSEAQLKLLKAGPRKEDVSMAEEQLRLTEIILQQAESERERFKQLYESNAATQQMYQEVNTKYDQALNQVKTARENLSKIKTIIRPEEIASAKAVLKRNQLNVEQIQKSIEDCTVKSPVSGIVSQKISEKGEFVTPGSSVLKISDLNTLNLYIYVSEEQLGKIKLGQEAEVKTDTFKDRIYKGDIIFISPEAEFTPKNIQTQEERTKLVFAVKIRISNEDLTLKSGMPADAKLYLK